MKENVRALVGASALAARTKPLHCEAVIASRSKVSAVVLLSPSQSLIRAVPRVLPFVAPGNGEHAW
jgi:hypothetical protein